MTTKEQLHQLIDQLPASEWHAAERYLEYLRDACDPALRALLDIPEDDEPESPEEATAVAAAKARAAAGLPGIPHDEVRRRVLGLP